MIILSIYEEYVYSIYNVEKDAFRGTSSLLRTILSRKQLACNLSNCQAKHETSLSGPIPSHFLRVDQVNIFSLYPITTTFIDVQVIGDVTVGTNIPVKTNNIPHIT